MTTHDTTPSPERLGERTARFWSHVDRRGSDECWPWLANRNPKGYGRVAVGRGHQQAHRVAYELAVGPIPAGLQLDHLCRNRGCVNPAHLEPVTNRENILRGRTLPAANLAKTTCYRGHALAGDNLYPHPNGERRCRICVAIYKAAFRERRKAASRLATPVPADDRP